MQTYQYVLRLPTNDEVRFVRHENLEIGDRVEIDGNAWIVRSITRTARWENIHRVMLLPAAADVPPRQSQESRNAT